MASAGSPASSSARTSGGSSAPFGTGRVTSQMAMHAERAAPALSASPARASAAATSAAESATTGMAGLRTTVGRQSAATRTGSSPRP